jgi:hypothetical protein
MGPGGPQDTNDGLDMIFCFFISAICCVSICFQTKYVAISLKV